MSFYLQRLGVDGSHGHGHRPDIVDSHPRREGDRDVDFAAAVCTRSHPQLDARRGR